MTLTELLPPVQEPASTVPGDPPTVAALIGRRYDAIVAKGLAFHAARPALAIKLKLDGSPRGGRPPRRVGHNLLLRLSERKQDVLRFLTNPDVPFTNNQAERDARMMVTAQVAQELIRPA